MGLGQSKASSSEEESSSLENQCTVQGKNGPFKITGFSNNCSPSSFEKVSEEFLKKYLVFSTGGKVSYEHPPSGIQINGREYYQEGGEAIVDLNGKLIAFEDECAQSVAADVYANQVTFDAESASLCTLADGTRVTLPLDQDSVKGLLEAATPAALGIEGKGDVIDPSLRLTKEIPAGNLKDLNHMFQKFDFPSALSSLHAHLCPGAEEISAQPYKLLIYEPGDFFSLHVDTMHHPDQFGSLALEIPLTEECLEFDGEEEKEGEKESTEDWKESVDKSKRGGELVFYSGRVQSDVVEKEGHSEIDFLRANNIGWGSYMIPTKDRARMMQRLRLTTNPDDQTPSTLTAQFGAWLGDIPHEVRRLNKGYRVALIYNLIKVGSRSFKIPRRVELLDKTQTILNALKASEFTIPLPDPNDFDEDPADGKKVLELRKSGPRTLHSLGVILRHPYTAGGFCASNLKGIDAVLYHALSFHYQCYFLMATECRPDYPCAPFRRVSNNEEHGCVTTVFVGTSMSEAGIDPYDEDSADEMFTKNPVIGGCAWAAVGQGTLLGGGHSYGNADCGADWWYRSCVMIISDELTPWHRGRRSAMLLGLRGPETFKQLFAVRDVFEQILQWI